MKAKLTIFIIILVSPLLLTSQNTTSKFRARIQASVGGVYTKANETQVSAFSVNGEDYYGYQYSIQATVLTPIRFINLGLGAGLSYRYSTNISDIYHSSIYPKLFILLEIGNASKRSSFSFIITPGLMQGPVEKKACFYVGGGPSFNIGREFRKVTVSITPYIEFHGGEKKDLKYFDTRMGHPGEELDYSLHYKTITFNIACLVQLNSFRKAKQQPKD